MRASAAPTGRSVEVPVPGGRLHVEEHGAGDPLLLIQGLGYAVWGWRYQIPAFAARFRTIALDNRGAGRSSKPPGPYSIERLADDAAEVLRALDAEGAHVVGISMGGYIAQTLALRHPGLVRSLVLSGTGPGEPTHEPVPEETRSIWLANADRPPGEYARRTMYLSFSPGWTDEHPEEYEALLAARLEFPTPPEAWRAQYDACVRWVEAGSPVETISVPTLVIHGDADRVVPVANGYALAERIPGAELVVLRGGGHVAPLEDPDAWNGAVLDFLSRVA